MMAKKYRASFIIPLYKSEESLPDLISSLERLNLDAKQHEFIFVNDASPDQTLSVISELLRNSNLSYKLLLHTRNYGEHNSVLTGYRHSRGDYVINLDDDLQNPPQEAIRLLQYAETYDCDVVYGDYQQKMHAHWRNLGSQLANFTARFLLNTDPSIYLSSFRCLRGDLARQVAAYRGPYPYIDGLIPQYTTDIRSLTVKHCQRDIGSSSYNVRRLVRLWLIIFTSFSIMPLRLATILGILSFLIGVVFSLALIFDYIANGTIAPGWTSTLCIILSAFGIQSLLIGILGEYLGRVLLTVSNKPQSHVRQLITNQD